MHANRVSAEWRVAWAGAAPVPNTDLDGGRAPAQPAPPASAPLPRSAHDAAASLIGNIPETLAKSQEFATEMKRRPGSRTSGSLGHAYFALKYGAFWPIYLTESGRGRMDALGENTRFAP